MELCFTTPHRGRGSVYEWTADAQKSLNENAGGVDKIKQNSLYVDSQSKACVTVY